MFQAMFRAQCGWDAAMGWNAVQALKKHGGEKAIMVVLIGSGHVAYGLGAERQVKLWYQGKTASVIPVPVVDEDHAVPLSSVQASYADFVWGLPRSADPLYPSLGISTPEAKSGERYHVIMVAPDSPAAAAGFQLDDELVSMDGVPIVDKETSNRMMSEKRWGDSVVYKVMRDGKELTLTAHLRRQPPKGAKKDEPAPAAPKAPLGSQQ
jgi:S1-C subfamily serine protease